LRRRNLRWAWLGAISHVEVAAVERCRVTVRHPGQLDGCLGNLHCISNFRPEGLPCPVGVLSEREAYRALLLREHGLYLLRLRERGGVVVAYVVDRPLQDQRPKVPGWLKPGG
jgi:hypothetical protein